MLPIIQRAWRTVRRDMLTGESSVSERHKFERVLCKRAQLQARLSKAAKSGWDPTKYINRHKFTYELEAPSVATPDHKIPVVRRTKDLFPAFLTWYVSEDILDPKVQDKIWKEKLQELQTQDKQQRDQEKTLYDYQMKEVETYKKILNSLLSIYTARFWSAAPQKALDYVHMKNPVKEVVFEENAELAAAEPMASSTAFTLDDAMRVLGFTTKPSKEEVEEKVEKIKVLNDPEKGGSLFLAQKAEEAGATILSALASGIPFPSLVGKG